MARAAATASRDAASAVAVCSPAVRSGRGGSGPNVARFEDGPGCLNRQQQVQARLDVISPRGVHGDRHELGLEGVQFGQLRPAGPHRQDRPVQAIPYAASFDHQSLVLLSALLDGFEGLAGAGRRVFRGGRGAKLRVGLEFGGFGGGDRVFCFDRESGEVGEHAAEAVVVTAKVAGFPTGHVASGVERGDPEQLHHQSPALRRRVVGERGELLLLGEHRRPEGQVVHPEHRLDVALGVLDSRRHECTVTVGFHADRRIDALQGSPDEVEMSLVLELHLGDAVPAGPRGPDLLLGRAGLSPQGEYDGFQQGRFAGAVRSEDPYQAGRKRKVELVLVDTEVAEVQPGDQHQGEVSEPSTA